MASATPLMLLLFLSLLHITTATPPQSIPNAAKTLYNSGYSSMSFSLPLATTGAAGKLLQSHPTLTIFAPPDSAFETSGQPPRTQLLLHFSPLPLSLKFLSSLPYATTIPTLSNASLVITTLPQGPVSINNVAVFGSPLYDDGSVIVFAIEDFFDSNFTIHGVGKIQKRMARRCSDISAVSMVFDAASRLKSRGYSIMASFLELQLMGYLKSSPWPLKLTMFAPDDEVLLRFSGDILGYSGLFMRHLLPCKLTYADIVGVKNGTFIKKNFEGLGTMIEENDGDFFVNGVRITFPDVYVSDSLVIHGIGDAISQQIDGSGEEEEVEVEDKHVAFPVPP
ncbi:hypothetical protein Leryth_015854 [Lithospermum erythrorhizon]|nr:hypothetical protein Leryth_015854 [Lithospermum erythrorhizon]